MEIFISWSKDKSRLLALETKKFILNTLGNKIEVFFLPICIREPPLIMRYILIF